MSIADRDSLAKCCALLGGLTWILAILVVAGALMLLHEVAAIPRIGADTIAAGDASAAIASSTLAGGRIRGAERCSGASSVASASGSVPASWSAGPLVSDTLPDAGSSPARSSAPSCAEKST